MEPEERPRGKWSAGPQKPDRHDELIAALIDNQLRTEESLRRLERSVESLADSVSKVVGRERPSD